MNKIKLIADISGENPVERARYYDNCGADELYYFDQPSFEEGKEENIKLMKEICQNADIPLNVFAKVNRFEDVKKMIYAGAKKVIVRTDIQDNLEEVKIASDRFGKERIFLYLKSNSMEECIKRAQTASEEGFGGVVLDGGKDQSDLAKTADYLKTAFSLSVDMICREENEKDVTDLLKMSMPSGVILSSQNEKDMMELKQILKKEKLPVNCFESAIDFEEFTLNSDGMIPVVTQDYKTGQVLMVAYMTKEAFEKTVATGKMTYFSRSRQELWTKGETSGHYQYVKSLDIDCDKDTILAKVAQIGAACHTGNRSCFYTNLLAREYDNRNPLAVFEEVFATIQDRKEHPKEGSYTNYLFEKGVDKILKKVGEEATEIVIAAKNPDSDELKYEICDFLYHMMVLMADQGVSWKEITDELAQRH